MENQRDKEFVLPKNIRQMGKLGETYKIYVEDFVYTYVHRTLREEQKNPDFVAAVLLGRHFSRAGPVSYTHLRAHETDSYLVCRLLLEKKKNSIKY